ncbi:hypothetical protein CO661_29650 [Sinorhizobium fredii]|uniref:Uncharacterized protein n=1 Tax=Rhizobium fredii TaxID=380 RepID=A0A2A6LQ60_RHIFR|nr:hypothetical protein [Sinorhizobium fredii]PDT44356.1 hypothetical protein CO661_29650 [Sinorhizobium fredii]
MALVVETSDGPIEDFFVNQVAAAAVAFAAKEATFSATDLPGDLSDKERAAIADALIESGLFVQTGGYTHG